MPEQSHGVPSGAGDERDAAGDERPTKAGGRKGAIYVAAMLLVAVAASAIYFYFRSSVSANTAPARTEEEITLALEPFIVNLDGPGQRAYLRVGITLGVSGARPLKKDDAMIAPLRDAILSVLSSAQPEQLAGAEGKQKLKADLLKALQARLPDLGIEDVYFTEFLVQM